MALAHRQRLRSDMPLPVRRTLNRLVAVLLLASATSAERVPAQTEATAWGNVTGIRVEGQVMPFETSLCTLGANGEEIARTAQERQQPRFSRSGNGWTVGTRLGTLAVDETVRDTGPGAATLDVRYTADSAATPAGGYLCLDVPRSEFAGGTVQLVGTQSQSRNRVTLALTVAPDGGQYLRGVARGVRFVNGTRQLDVSFGSPAEAIVRGDRRRGDDDYRVYVAVMPGPSAKGRSARNVFTVKAVAPIDRAAATLALDATRPGRMFDGLGGNFRIQNPAVDPKVIAYNLANMRVAWGRVEMPWRTWQPDENTDPSATAPDRLDPRIRAAMEMARTLAQKDVPVIVSAWFPPQWAVLGEIHSQPVPGAPRGNQLDPAKMEKIYASITSYLLYLKRHYGVEAALFSFNESDLGIDVRQTAQEHDDFIKGLGGYLAAKGLSTKLLLGDTSDATPTAFIGVAMGDSAAWPFIGAVSFHSWRGWTDELFTFWRNASRKLNVPLLVGEGSTDAGAWKYPSIFLESKFAHDEIFLYVRILAASEPKSILQWQLTSDYSLLAGGGVFGDTTALRPTQRFWNLKQLASTPPHAFHLPVSCGRSDLSCAAFGDIANGAYALHVVNDGAARQAMITGLPSDITELRIWITDGKRGMIEGPRVAVNGGGAKITLDAASFTTVVGWTGVPGER
jgi:hypothetical protein